MLYIKKLITIIIVIINHLLISLSLLDSFNMWPLSSDVVDILENAAGHPGIYNEMLLDVVITYCGIHFL